MTEELLNVIEGAKYAHICEQAFRFAITCKKLNARKIGRKWYTTKKDIDDYRLRKHNRDYTKIDGELVFDVEKGHFSINHLCKIISDATREPCSRASIYKLIQSGELPHFKKGSFIIIRKGDAKALLEKKMTTTVNFFGKPHLG